MKFLTKIILALSLIIMVFSACKRDELDMDKFSDKITIERTLAMPLVYGTIYLRNFINDVDSVLIIETDTSFTDTVGINFSDSTGNIKDFELEYFRLHHNTKNYLPVAFDLWFVSYDSISQTNLDTIRFVENGYFLQAAPIDNSGNPIESEVDSTIGVLEIDNRIAENILNVATHVIIEARLISDTTIIIPINPTKRISLKYGFEAKGRYTSN